MRLLLTLLALSFSITGFAQRKISHKINFGMNYVIGTPDYPEYEDLFDNTYNDYLSLKFDYVASFNLNPYISFGPGFGIRHLLPLDETLVDNSTITNVGFYSSYGIANYFAIPIFVNFNARFLDRKVSPFVSLSTGYSFSLNEQEIESYDQPMISKINSGFITNGQVGVHIRFRNGMGISAGPYFEFQPAKATRTISDFRNSEKLEEDRKLHHIGLQLGFGF